MFRTEVLFVVIGSLSLLAGCSKADNPRSEPVQSGAVAAPAEKFTPASVFPSGPGREMVVSSCGSCHSLLCGVKGQRTAERWDSIKLSHRDKLASVSSSDLDKMFAYLKEHFNDTKPEPTIPAEFLQEGCTPY
jgi:cytochrome c5